MIQNKLVLYCTRLEQAILWEACKRRRCPTSNCPFKKIAKHYGENLWSKEPMRISTINDAKENLEHLTKPIPLIRTPVLSADLNKSIKINTIIEQDKALEPEPELAQAAPCTTYALPNDMLREEIAKLSKNLK